VSDQYQCEKPGCSARIAWVVGGTRWRMGYHVLDVCLEHLVDAIRFITTETSGPVRVTPLKDPIGTRKQRVEW
jgi:hypothetical protein